MQIITHNETELVLRSNSIKAKALLAVICLTSGIFLLTLMIATNGVGGLLLCLLAFGAAVYTSFSLVARAFVLDKGAGYLVRTIWAPWTLWRPHITRYPLYGAEAVSLGWKDEHESCLLGVKFKSGEIVEIEKLKLGKEEDAPKVVSQIAQLAQVAELVSGFLRVPVNSSAEFRVYHLPPVASAQTPPKCPGCGGHLPLGDRMMKQVTCSYCGMTVPIEWTQADSATRPGTQ